MAEPSPEAPAAAQKEGAAPSGFTIEGVEFRARKPAAGLHIVATPIGNLEDVTLRALHALAGADRLYCEDTRITRRLLERYCITTRLGIYDDHRGHKARAEIIRLVSSGASVALVSDAGTPLISDPGYKLVREMRDAGLPVFVIPGASALTAAAAIAGIATDRLCFAGFLAPKRAARRRAIAELAGVAATLVLYESPRRLAATLADLADILGPRDAALARELTKINEEVVRLPLDQMAERYASETTRGEIVILIAAAGPQAADPQALDLALGEALERASLRDASAEVAARFNAPRGEVYARALKIKRSRSGNDAG